MRKIILLLLLTAIYGAINNVSAQNQSVSDSIKRTRATQQQIDDITRALKSNGVHISGKANMYVYLGNQEVSIKHYSKAIANYNSALSLHPGLGLAYLNRGDAYRYQKDFQKAESDYKQAVVHLKGDDAN